MPNDMPVELLREVFDIALHVPDHLFFDTTTNSPFAHVQASTSNLLIVCKRWLKIATPAFYETLILRSRAQILSLCSAIAANPQFAIRIRRMRVEGRFHDFIGDTAKHMTALHAVCFAFDAEYITKMPGVVKLLRAVNPRIAAFPTILHTSFATSNKVNKMVGDAIRRWGNLHTLVLPHMYAWHLDGFSHVLLSVATTLFGVTQVTLTVGSIAGVTHLTVHPTIRTLLQRLPPPRVLLLLQEANLLRSHHFDSLDPASRRLISFGDLKNPSGGACTVSDLYLREEVASCSTAISWSNPLERASVMVQAKIWQAIIRQALSLACNSCSTMYPHNAWFNPEGVDCATARSLLFTNRSFAHYTVAALVEYILITSNGPAQIALSNLLEARPTLRSSIRSLYINAHGAVAAQILSAAPRLGFLELAFHNEKIAEVRRVFSSIVLSRRSIRHLVVTSSFSDQAMRFDTPKKANNLSRIGEQLLDDCDALTTLRWNILSVTFTMPANQDVLTCLEDISTSRYCYHFIQWATTSKLPLLKKFSLSAKAVGVYQYKDTNKSRSEAVTAFLKTHGPKLQEFFLDDFSVYDTDLLLCTRLVKLQIGLSANSSTVAKVKHPSVKYIIIHWSSTLFLAHLEKLLRGLYEGSYPALEQVVSTRSDFWPTTESALGSNQWQTEATQKLNARGVTLMDKEGRVWRPRLEVKDVLRRSGRVADQRK